MISRHCEEHLRRSVRRSFLAKAEAIQFFTAVLDCFANARCARGWRPMSVTEQGVFDKPDDAAIPGIVGSHAKLGLLLEDEAAVSGVADLKAHGIFGPARSGDDPAQGLSGAELVRDIGLAATAHPQRLCLRR